MVTRRHARRRAAVPARARRRRSPACCSRSATGMAARSATASSAWSRSASARPARTILGVLLTIAGVDVPHRHLARRRPPPHGPRRPQLAHKRVRSVRAAPTPSSRRLPGTRGGVRAAGRRQARLPRPRHRLGLVGPSPILYDAATEEDDDDVHESQDQLFPTPPSRSASTSFPTAACSRSRSRAAGRTARRTSASPRPSSRASRTSASRRP